MRRAYPPFIDSDLGQMIRQCVYSLRLLALLPAPVLGQAVGSGSLRGSIELSIGGPAESRPDYLFEAVSGLYLASDGRLFAAEPKADRVRVYDAAGRLLQAFGRSGEGPGDFRFPCCLSLDAVGQLWVRDAGLSRYSVYSLTGPAQLSRTIKMPEVSQTPTSRPHWGPSGQLIHVWQSRSRPGSVDLTIADMDADGKTSNAVVVPPVARVPKTVRVASKEKAGAFTELVEPFSGVPLRKVGLGGEFVVAYSGEYRIDWYDRGGKLMRTIRRDVRGPAIGRVERDSAENAIADQARRLGVRRSSIDLRVPQAKPPIMDIGFDLEGRLWVQLASTQAQDNVADLYDRTGRQIAVVRWPTNVQFYQWSIRGSSGLGVAFDADGTQSIVRVAFKPDRASASTK
ncbi:MAG: hypothetical protein IPG05_01545 [Gemmatimonadetes bacterium]|nr:hypothetical protein [Gemmatimonadota bacterium]